MHDHSLSFQTISANHPKYMPAISVLGLVAALMVAFGFGLLPVVILLKY